MKLLFPKELIDENLEGFKEKVTRTLQLFPKAFVPRDIHGEIVYPAVNHPPDTHCKEKRLGGSKMPLDRRRKRCENTIRAKTIGRGRAEDVDPGRNGMLGRTNLARQKPLRGRTTGRNRPRSAESRIGTDRPYGRSGKQTFGLGRISRHSRFGRPNRSTATKSIGHRPKLFSAKVSPLFIKFKPVLTNPKPT
ncbi:unnamed protein product [Microthlaspi erraticum]|uniref:Uncharacterized protein n=1 Tax=Microthlaspi erraticum TaxID=1685480 RepID=A0A6D2JU45_9BRAS|nr:unnamed protein product [Microthlaspi erraticum]